MQVQPVVFFMTDIAGKIRRRVVLVGTCWYELTGLWHLLSAQGYDVYFVPPGDSCARNDQDLVIVALSAEPVAGWGRHLARIRELRKKLSGEMLVLVPERLEALKVLRDVCPIYSGRGHLSYLKGIVHMALNRENVRAGQFRLTSGQRRALKRFSESGRDSPLNLEQNERILYWHYARLAENVGVRNFRLLLMAGLEREIRETEEGQHAK
ncbi:TPA: hypothetical protein J1Y36_002880 [Escherichia coli]|nr:hypothetical protein [Escherichia coli]